MDLPTYGWFQSVLQLSVGTNLTFAVVLSLIDHSMRREKYLSDELLESAKTLLTNQNTNDGRRSDLRSIYTRAQELRVSIVNRSEMIDNITYFYFKPICILMFMVALYLFVDFTYNYNSPIAEHEKWIAIGTLIPFLVFSLIIISLSYWNSWQASSTRNEIEDALEHAIPNSH